MVSSRTNCMKNIRQLCWKILTSQLHEISPDAKVIDARKLVSLIMQLALSVYFFKQRVAKALL